MGRPLVSVVTVCYNAERHLAEAMGSVLAQTYPDVEYIVVDGGSTDGTPDIIRSFEPRFGDRLCWTSETDGGIYDAMNKGIARARGEIIGLLNADDAYLPDAIARVVAACEAHPSSGAVFGDADIVDDAGRVLRTERAVVPAASSIPARMPMCHQALFVTRRVYETLGTYDTHYAILADYEFVLRMLHVPVELLHIPVPLVRFRVGGVCSTDMARSNAERERIRVAYGANPIIERARRARHAINRFVYALLHDARSEDGAQRRAEGKCDK